MKQQYRVRAGVRFGKLKQYGPGDVVEMTAEEAAGFLDKLELVDVVLPVAASSSATGELDGGTPPAAAGKKG